MRCLVVGRACGRLPEGRRSLELRENARPQAHGSCRGGPPGSVSNLGICRGTLVACQTHHCQPGSSSHVHRLRRVRLPSRRFGVLDLEALPGSCLRARGDHGSSSSKSAFHAPLSHQADDAEEGVLHHRALRRGQSWRCRQASHSLDGRGHAGDEPRVAEAAHLFDDRQQVLALLRQLVFDARRRLCVAPADDDPFLLERAAAPKASVG